MKFNYETERVVSKNLMTTVQSQVFAVGNFFDDEALTVVTPGCYWELKLQPIEPSAAPGH